MERNMARIGLSLVLMMFFVGGCGKRTERIISPQGDNFALEGVVSLMVEVPAEIVAEMERAGLTDDKLSQGTADPLDGKVKVIFSKEGAKVYQRLLNGVSVSVGADSVITDQDGRYRFLKVPEDQSEIVVSFQGQRIISHSLVIPSSGRGIQDLEIRMPIEEMMENKKKHRQEMAAMGWTPCLDNNGVGWMSFINSDCFVSMFHYGFLYCWWEAMSSSPDHYGGVWCNGAKNCSLISHRWQWWMQSWHSHGWWPWWAR